MQLPSYTQVRLAHSTGAVHQGLNVDFKIVVIKQLEEEVTERKEKTTEQRWAVCELLRIFDRMTALPRIAITMQNNITFFTILFLCLVSFLLCFALYGPLVCFCVLAIANTRTSSLISLSSLSLYFFFFLFIFILFSLLYSAYHHLFVKKFSSDCGLWSSVERELMENGQTANKRERNKNDRRSHLLRIGPAQHDRIRQVVTREQQQQYPEVYTKES